MNDLRKIPEYTERMEAEQPSRLGQWFWVYDEDWEKKPFRWLGCVTHEGSNYVKISGVGDRSCRVHLDEFHEVLTPEPDPEGVIARKVEFHRGRSANLIQKVSDIVHGLGIQPKTLPHLTGSTALTAPAGAREVKDYSRALVTAEKETLPALFEQIKEANKSMAAWMSAPTLPMQAQLGTAMSTVKLIQQRIYAIELYAGVTEEIVQIAEGQAAPAHEKVRLFQRRLYMDEECLADYRSGGMEFNGIDKFEAWLLKPSNRDRIMPSPKCVVSMRVRRTTKERQSATQLSIFINIKLDELDESTFLYIRNGENVYRLASDIDFGQSLFPDRATFDPMRPMMAKMFGSCVDTLLDREEFEALKAADEERERNSKKWLRNHPKTKWNKGKDGDREWANPYRYTHFRASEYEPFDPSTVYYDDISEVVAERIAHYNRVALIIQGLFDRSVCFQPHLMAKTWQPEDFMRAVELVYDNSGVLHHGDAPDFEAYREKINAGLGAGSVTIGQERFWMKAEAVKYNEQANRSSYRGRVMSVDLHKPYGNPGPGFTATIDKWNSKARSATFRWLRNRVQSWRSDGPDKLPTAITVSAGKLFNVNGYTPGDFKRFYADSRTRAQYLKWAPFLLGAEDWHAAQRKKNP